jgi:hypothetical protein
LNPVASVSGYTRQTWHDLAKTRKHISICRYFFALCSTLRHVGSSALHVCSLSATYGANLTCPNRIAVCAIQTLQCSSSSIIQRNVSLFSCSRSCCGGAGGEGKWGNTAKLRKGKRQRECDKSMFWRWGRNAAGLGTTNKSLHRIMKYY